MLDLLAGVCEIERGKRREEPRGRGKFFFEGKISLCLGTTKRKPRACIGSKSGSVSGVCFLFGSCLLRDKREPRESFEPKWSLCVGLTKMMTFFT